MEISRFGARKTERRKNNKLIIIFLLVGLFFECRTGTPAYLNTYPGVISKTARNIDWHKVLQEYNGVKY